MVSLLYPVMDYICLLILAFLGLQNEKFSNIGQKQRYLRFLITTVSLFCFVDALWGFFATHPVAPNFILFILTTLYFLLLGLIATIWVRFVVYYVGLNPYFLNNAVRLILYYIPFIAEVALLIINFKTGFLFYINEKGEYFRNPNNSLYFLFGIQFLYYLAAIVISVFQSITKKNINQNIRISVHCFSLIPLFFVLIQLKFPYMPFYAIGLMLSVFDLFIFDVIDEREVASNRTLILQQKQIFEKCNQILNQTSSVQRNIDSLLQLVLSYYNADRIFILEIDPENPDFLLCNYEYSKTGVSVKMKELNEIQMKWFEPFVPFVQGKDFFKFDDLSVFTVEEKYLDLFSKHNVQSGIVAPIRFTGKTTSFIGIDNPKVHDFDFSILRTVMVFIYSELLRHYQTEVEQKTNIAVLLALAAEYSSVYYIDAKTGELNPYRYDSQMKRLYGDYYKDRISYKAAYEMYLNDVVVEADRDSMKPYADVDFVSKKLKNRKNIKKQFLSNINGKEEYFQAKWVRVDNNKDDIPDAFVLGIANIDDQVRNKELLNEQKKELEKQQAELDTVKVKAEDAKRISQTDQLTDLYNKVSGQYLICDYISTKPADEKYALIFIDIDKFKNFNDKFGHLVGDEILMEVGKTIKSKCRQNDIPIRFGGDEFVILLKKQFDEGPAMRKVEAIQKELETLSLGKEWTLTCSIGIYLTDSSDFDEAIEKADNALYDVKGSGRNNVKLIK